MAILKNTIVTSALQLPSGTSAQRPTTPTVGMMRYNTTYNITEMYDGSQWWDLTNNVYSDIGLSASTPAISGTQLLQTRPTFTSGNYFIQPPGQSCYQVYVDLLNQGGGWVLVGTGREGIFNSANAWYVESGSPNGLYTTQLTSSFMSSSTTIPRYMPRDWIRALVKGYTWNSMTGMIINRTVAGDSFFLRNSPSEFSWRYFGGAGDVQIFTAIRMNFSRFTGQWLGGTNSYNFNNNQFWGDTLSAGAPVANDITRMFTWSWSGHSSGGNQYMGFSAGSSYTNGFMVGAEGHAIQHVNIFVK